MGGLDRWGGAEQLNALAGGEAPVKAQDRQRTRAGCSGQDQVIRQVAALSEMLQRIDQRINVLHLVQTLGDSIAAGQTGPELTDAERQLIDQRLDRFLSDGDAGLDTEAVLGA